MPSTVISSFHYDTDTSTLRIIFVSGSIYDYLNVPPEKYNALKRSGSKGTYLNRNIKGHFPFKKIN